jgi:ElaB/YqjD/DUF883 family membrane-anchored ribosome-binding protein
MESPVSSTIFELRDKFRMESGSQMFGRKKRDYSVVSESVSEFFTKKTEDLHQRKRILRSRVDQAIHGNHMVSESVSEFFTKKTQDLHQRKRILRSRIDQALHGKHKHFFSKQDLLENKHNARCQVCGMSVGEFRVQRIREDWSPHLRPVRRNSVDDIGSSSTHD